MDGASLYRIVAVSDIHHDVERLQRLLPIINSATCFVCCGDGVSDVMYVRGGITVPIVCVNGNNDRGFNLSEIATTVFGSTRAMIVHGHKFDVRNGLKLLYVTALHQKCELVFYGHTHMFSDKTVQGVHFINPGALCNGSYALVAGDGTNFVCKQGTI